MSDTARIADIMSKDVCCVQRDLSLAAAGLLLLEKGLQEAPVVDERGAPTGTLAYADVLRPDRDGLRVFDVMGPAFTLKDGMRVVDAAAALAKAGTHRAVIVDGRGLVVGLLSAIDVLRWLGSRAPPEISSMG